MIYKEIGERWEASSKSAQDARRMITEMEEIAHGVRFKIKQLGDGRAAECLRSKLAEIEEDIAHVRKVTANIPHDPDRLEADNTLTMLHLALVDPLMDSPEAQKAIREDIEDLKGQLQQHVLNQAFRRKHDMDVVLKK